MVERYIRVTDDPDEAAFDIVTNGKRLSPSLRLLWRLNGDTVGRIRFRRTCTYSFGHASSWESNVA